jgi:hypothetical protein
MYIHPAFLDDRRKGLLRNICRDRWKDGRRDALKHRENPIPGEM